MLYPIGVLLVSIVRPGLSSRRTGIAPQSLCYCASTNHLDDAEAMILSYEYETVKHTSLQDSRLGLLRYALVGAILISMVVFGLWGFGGYFASVPIHGALPRHCTNCSSIGIRQSRCNSLGNKQQDCYPDRSLPL
jgi:hypothetical protein